MNKSELAEHISQRLNLSKKQIEDTITAMLEVITETLQTGGDISFTGFGNFETKQRAAHMGVNPQKPGEKVEIPAMCVPKFKAGTQLKAALKNSVSRSLSAGPARPTLQ